MRKLASFLLVAAIACAFAPRATAQTSDKCIHFWGETRYGALAFNHIVHVANGCSATADCTVSTNVNPDPQKVAVEGHSETEVMTFMGSPARTFTPKVSCVMRQQ